MMSRSGLTFLPKNKQVAGMAIGAIAILAVAVPALTQEAPNKDEVFTRTTAIRTGANPLVSFDISWFDPDPTVNRYFLADRSNNQIDVVNPSDNSITPIAQGIFAGVQPPPPAPTNNTIFGPNGVLTVHQDNGVTELWVGDTGPGPGPGRVWVINATTGEILTPTPISVGGTHRADELCFDSKDHLIMI